MRVPHTIMLMTAVSGLVCWPQAARGKSRKDIYPPKIVHQIVTQAPRGVFLKLMARIHDASGIFEPKVYYRQSGTKDYSAASMVKSGRFYLAVIPAKKMDSGIEYFIEAFDENGNGPARHGSPETPHMVLLTAAGPVLFIGSRQGGKGLQALPAPGGTCSQADAPVYCKWWFWTLVVVPILAGGGVGMYFTLRPGEIPSGSTTIDLNVVAPDPRP